MVKKYHYSGGGGDGRASGDDSGCGWSGCDCCLL